MSRSNHLLKPLLALTAFAVASSSRLILAQDAFHITFGTTGTPESYFADGARFVIETENREIAVAGAGASFFSDDGTGFTYPLIARVAANGRLKWQRVYYEIVDQNITSVLPVGEEQFIMLRGNPTLGSLNFPGLSLHRVDRSGDLSESLGALEGFPVLEPFPVIGIDPHFLVLAARHGATPGPFLDIRLFRMHLRGDVSELASVAGIASLENLVYPGGDELLVSRLRQSEPFGDGQRISVNTDIIRVHLTGQTEVVFTIANRMCRSLAASLTRIFCIEYEWPETEGASDALVAYSASGQVLWRHALELDVQIGQMRPVESGGLIYSYMQGMSTIVTRLSASGTLLWTRRLRSTGPYAFLAGIEQLQEERLALFGSTGTFGGFVSTDTNAMLIVTDTTGGELSAEIESTVVDSADAR